MNFRWRRWLIGALTFILVAVAFQVGKELFARSRARADLDEIIAELDKSDPRWRLADLEADRKLVPPEKNAADTVVAAHRLLPNNWEPVLYDCLEMDDAPVGRHQGLELIPPPVVLRKEQADELAAELKGLEPALDIARKLRAQPSGRYKIDYAPVWFNTAIADQQKARDVAKLLYLEAALCLERKDMANAWHANQALLNAARSVGDEPVLVTMLMRMAIDVVAVHNLERALGQGEFLPVHLEERQAALEEELAVPHFSIGLRGERAATHETLSSIESGQLALLQALDKNHRPGFLDPINEFLAFSGVLRSHAEFLTLESRAIEASRLPMKERSDGLNAVDAAFREISPDDKSRTLVRLLLPAFMKVAQSENNVHTWLACAVAGLGAERFRLDKKRWPASLDELVEAGCLKKIPADLQNPLLLRRTKDGLVIYTVGRSGNYDGKALDDLRNINAGEVSLRMEFRLWDPEHRKQPPLARKAKEEDQ